MRAGVRIALPVLGCSSVVASRARMKLCGVELSRGPQWVNCP